MLSGKLTKRLTTLALAIATSACAPRASVAQTAVEPSPAVPAEPAQPAVPAQPAAEPTTQPNQRRVDELRRRADETLRAQERGLSRAQTELAKTHADLAKREAGFKTVWAMPRVISPDAPTIISTESMEAAATTEWTEDLKVMDKVIREEVTRAGSDGPEAMGIKLTMIGREGPMYVEGAGVIFSAGVHFPLAPIGATSGSKDDKPRDPASKWERAKRELKGSPKPNEFRAISVKDGKVEAVPDVTFDQAKLDALTDALIKALPEASNIRHLKGGESVFITITGSDEGGEPARMTLKATKADIDAAAEGKLAPDEFAKRVARRIG